MQTILVFVAALLLLQGELGPLARAHHRSIHPAFPVDALYTDATTY